MTKSIPEARLASNMTRLGLPLRESTVYVALLAHGPQSVVGLASYAKLSRPLVYEILPHLEARGLISRTKRGKRDIFVACHPDTLRVSVEEAKECLDEVVDELCEIAHTHHTTTNVAIFHGKEGIRKVFADMVTLLEKGDVFYRYSGPSDIARASQYLPPHYRVVRDTKGLERYVITREDIRHTKKPRLERDIKVLPGTTLKCNLTKLIFGTRVAYIDYSKEVATVVYDGTIAEFEKGLFMDLWKKL